MQIRVGGTTDVEPVSITYKDASYDLKLYPNNKASETGHVVIAKLSPENNALPSFIFRWDHPAGVMDVDIFLGGKDCKNLWKQPGYKGHWTKLTDDKKREYSVLIEIPERKIFEGTVKVGLLTEINVYDTLNISESVNIKITDPI